MTNKGKKYVVYAHYIDETLIYIGCGNEKRPFLKDRRNFLWKRKVGTSKFDVKILSEFECKKKALDEESRLIKKYQPECNRVGVLRELTQEEKELLKADCKDRLSVDVGEKLKRKLVKYATAKRKSVSSVIRDLIEDFLKDD